MSETVFVTLKTTMGVSGARKVPNAKVQADEVTKITKSLFESPELEAIRSFDGDTRRYLEGITLPFEAGVKMVPVAAIEQVDRTLRQRTEARKALVDAFIDAYPRLKDEAEVRLSSVDIAGKNYNLWDPEDYPTAAAAHAGFSMTYQFVTFDAPDVLRGINAAVFDEQREALAQSIEDAKANANQLLCETALELVKHLRERIEPSADGKKKRLHETTVTNLTAFLDTLDLRNVTNNQELSQACSQMREVLSGTSANQLREGSDYHRQEIARELEKIEREIDTTLIPVARRRIAFTAEPDTQPAPQAEGATVADLFSNAEASA